MAQTSKTRCGLCETNAGMYFCYECKSSLCKSCRHTHDKIPATKSHAVIDMKRVDLSAFRSISNCANHEQDFSLYCTTCTIPVCSKCVATNHKGHEFSEIAPVVTKLRKTAQIQASVLKAKVENLSSSIKELKSVHLQTLQTEAKRLKADINSAIEQIQIIVDQKKKARIAEVENVEYFKKQELQLALQTKQKAYESQTLLCESLGNLLAEEHGTTFLTSYENLKRDLVNLGDDIQNVNTTDFHYSFPKNSIKLLCEEIVQDICMNFNIRLTGIANQQVTDIGNNNTPRRLGQRFAEIFEEVWLNAYEVLKPKKPDEKEETDEKTVDILQKILKVIYEFCKKTADQQTTFLVQGMMPPIINPLSGEQAPTSNAEELKLAGETEKMAKDYRKAVAPATITALQTAVCQEIIKAKLLTGDIGKELKEYFDNCVHLIWYMCIQQPPMILVWGEAGKKFNKELFRFSGKKGQKYRITVWPAVLFSEEGGLAAVGYAIPE